MVDFHFQFSFDGIYFADLINHWNSPVAGLALLVSHVCLGMFVSLYICCDWNRDIVGLLKL